MNQLLTALAFTLLCYANITSASSNTDPVHHTQEEKDHLNFQIISKLQSYQNGADINCNLRILNSTGETKFIQEVVVEFILETENKKTGSKSILNEKIKFQKNWIVANKDYAFYNPKNKKLSLSKKIRCTKIISCSIIDIKYGLSSDNKPDNKTVGFNKETTVGLISPVILKVNFNKIMDQGIGYYKKGLQESYIAPTKIECTMRFENTGSGLAKIKDDISINLQVGGVTISNPLKSIKIQPSESITQNVFSIHFSQNLNPSEIEMHLQAAKSKLLLQ